MMFALVFLLAGSALKLAAPASAGGGAYTLKWYAADPEPNRAPYLPTYVKVPPGLLACPTPSGGLGRADDPMMDAVAYGPGPTPLDAVTSLSPRDMALGQIVPFEMVISVSGSTAPENGVIQFTSGFETETSSNRDFGFDPAYMVYCAFVDYGDGGHIDIGQEAKVDSFSSTMVGTEIQGTFQVSGLDDGDTIIVEIWVVLKSTVPADVTGNVQTRLVSAQTVATPPQTISTGNQTVPLLQAGQFFSATADVGITKSDIPDPVVPGGTLTYNLLVTNNSLTTIANGVVVTDLLDPSTTFVSGSWANGVCTEALGTVTCNIGAIAQGQTVPITIVVKVNANAPTNYDTSTNAATGTCTVASLATGRDLCHKVNVT